MTLRSAAVSTEPDALRRSIAEDVTNDDVLRIASSFGERFIGVVGGDVFLDNILTSNRFTLPNSYYGIRLAPNAAAAWHVNRRLGMDLFVTDGMGVLKNDVAAPDAAVRVAEARARGERVIVFLGGSTIMGVGARLPQFSIPALVEAVLRDTHGIRSVCVNYGVASNTSMDSLNLLMADVLRDPPDCVVFYDGFNCSMLFTVLRMLAGKQDASFEVPLYPGTTVRHLEYDLTLRARYDLAFHARRAWRLAGNHALTSLVRAVPRPSVKQRALFWANRYFRLWGGTNVARAIRVASNPKAQRDDAVAGAVADYWYAHDMAHALCAGRGVDFITLLQPSVFWGNKPRTENEQRWAGEGALNGNPRGFEEFYRVLPRAQMPDYFVDFTGVFDSTSEEVYTDSVHLTRQGNFLVAQQVATLLAARSTA